MRISIAVWLSFTRMSWRGEGILDREKQRGEQNGGQIEKSRGKQTSAQGEAKKEMKYWTKRQRGNKMVDR